MKKDKLYVCQKMIKVVSKKGCKICFKDGESGYSKWENCFNHNIREVEEVK